MKKHATTTTEMRQRDNAKRRYDELEAKRQRTGFLSTTEMAARRNAEMTWKKYR